MADRYWVGGTGTWNASSTANWSATSGGATGASVPTSADNVFFNSASSASNYTVTLGSSFIATGCSTSIITSLTVVLTVATVTSGTLAVGNLVQTSASTTLRVTSFGTGSGGAGTYNCNVLCGQNGTGNSGLTVFVPPVCAAISFAGPASGTLTWVTTNSAIEVAGSVTAAASGVTMNPTLILTGAGSHTITTNNTPISADTYLCGTGTYTLGSAFNGSANLNFSLGTFTTANFTLTVGQFTQNSSGTRTINLGSSTVNINSSSYATGAGGGFGANVTFNAGTSQVNITANLYFFIQFGNKTWYNVSLTNTQINGGIGIALCSFSGDNPTFNNFSIAGQIGTGESLVLLQGNITINGTFTLGSASNAVTRLFLRSNTFGTTRTITAGAFAAGATDIDWQDITIAGAAGTISGTRFGNCGGNTGITFSTPKTVYWNLAGTQNWSATAWAPGSGGTPGVNNFPLAQDTAVFDNTGSVTGTITIELPWNLPTIDMSARTTAMTLATSNTPTIYGNWINGSGTTLSGTNNITFAGRNTQSITSAGKTFTHPITVNSPGGTVSLVDALTINAARTLTLNNGTFNANNQNVTVGLFNSAFSTTRTLTMGSGLWTLSGTGAVWNIASTNLTFNANTANILLSDTSTTDRTFAGSNLTYNTITIGGTIGTSTTTIQLPGNGVIGTLASTKTVAHTIAISSTPWSINNWTVTGTAGNVVTVNSSTVGTQQAITYTGSAVVSMDYMSIRDINFSYGLGATVPYRVYAGANSTNLGNNAGIAFINGATQRAALLTSGTTWTVPANWNNFNNTIHLIGAGGGGATAVAAGNNRAAGGAGGGGGYTVLTNQSFAPGAVVPYTIGTSAANTAGGSTTFNTTNTAGGGGAGFASSAPVSTGGAGGTGTFAGGTGGAGAFGTAASTGYASGGGGGAGGPNGAGGAGGAGFGDITTANIAGGGGGGNGGGSAGGNASSNLGGSGGNNSSGIGGAAGTNNLGNPGSFGGGGSGSGRGDGGGGAGSGGSGIDIANTVGGGGGRGGQGLNTVTVNTGLYGGGGAGGYVSTSGSATTGGAGSQGAIFIVWTLQFPTTVVTSFVNQISGNGSKSVCCFFRTNSINRMGIVGTRQTTSTGWVMCVNRTTAGNLTYFHTGGSTLEVAAGIVTGTWYYAVATYDLTTATATLYVNGSAIGSPATSFSPIVTSTFNGVVAAEDNALNNPFIGDISNLVIYNRALTQAEIAQNFQALRGRFGI